jgi:hypothetical protein
MPTLLKVLLAATAILAVIELVRGQPLVRWRRRQEHPLQTRGHALSLLQLVAFELARTPMGRTRRQVLKCRLTEVGNRLGAAAQAPGRAGNLPAAA